MFLPNISALHLVTDKFYVQSNDAEIVLNGNAGNDYFSVRSFTLEDEAEEKVRQELIAEGNKTAVVEGEV